LPPDTFSLPPRQEATPEDLPSLSSTSTHFFSGSQRRKKADYRDWLAFLSFYQRIMQRGSPRLWIEKRRPSKKKKDA